MNNLPKGIQKLLHLGILGRNTFQNLYTSKTHVSLILVRAQSGCDMLWCDSVERE